VWPEPRRPGAATVCWPVAGHQPGYGEMAARNFQPDGGSRAGRPLRAMSPADPGCGLKSLIRGHPAVSRCVRSPTLEMILLSQVKECEEFVSALST
jgi:hypothetical protein